MKPNIKHLAFLLFTLVLIACNHTPNENNNSKEAPTSLTTTNDTTIIIATVNDAVTSFVADTVTLRNDLRKFINGLSDSGNCELNRIEILMDAQAIKYYLVGSGTMNNEAIKTTIELERIGSKCLILSGLTVACTSACSGEASGCMPVLMACSKCSNEGKCIKTVTSSPKVIFPSVATGDCKN